MDLLIERVHSLENLEGGLSELTLEELEKELFIRRDEYLKGKIREIENSIFESYEESKRNEALKDTISRLDFSTLKQIDAIMRRNRKESQSSPAAIKPNGLSSQAINLYVALVKEIYCQVIDKYSSEYSLYDLTRINNGLTSFKEKLTTFGSYDKDKKFYAAEEAMDALSKINEEVVDRLSQDLSSNKDKNNSLKKDFRCYTHYAVPKK